MKIMKKLNQGSVYHLFPKLKSSSLLLITLTPFYTKMNTCKHACTHQNMHMHAHTHTSMYKMTPLKILE